MDPFQHSRRSTKGQPEVAEVLFIGYEAAEFFFFVGLADISQTWYFMAQMMTKRRG
jgi:cytochrome c biogenesis protein ResB